MSASRHSSSARTALALAALLGVLGTAAEAQDMAPPPAPTAERAAAYSADRAKSVLDLQQFRTSTSISVDVEGRRAGRVTLIDLNPNIGARFLLQLDRPGGAGATYDLENPRPRQRRLTLDEGDGLVITDGGQRTACRPWSGAPSALDQAKRSALSFAPLCDGRLYLRNRLAGHRTDLERVTELLREHLWGGEAVIGFVRRRFFGDAFRERAAPEGIVAPGAAEGEDRPTPARVGQSYADRAVTATGLGIAVEGSAAGEMVLGHWYRAAGLAGTWVGVMQPGAVADDILSGYRSRVGSLDAVESPALVYLAAFDLGDFVLGWVSGTAHPGVGWSPRPPASVLDPSLPGPDGFASVAPLMETGMLDPALAGRVVATFTGGFKREHGAFRYGPLALGRKGHHYGFVEQGIVLSKLQPDLATLYALADGSVGMKTWTEADDRLLPLIASARQNGVPLIASDPETGEPAPGPLVARWGAGNWSGSAEGKLRSLRAGACLMQTATRRFLIYAYFSTATPSAMARVFQAYGCSYAMLLDMNAPVHTYLAVYPRKPGAMVVEHLVTSMAEVDETRGKTVIPRFIGFPDNRDFFYLLRKEGR